MPKQILKMMDIKGDSIFQLGDNSKATINKKGKENWAMLLVITVVGGVLVYIIAKVIGLV